MNWYTERLNALFLNSVSESFKKYNFQQCSWSQVKNFLDIVYGNTIVKQ